MKISGWIGTVIVALAAACALLSLVWTPQDPLTVDPAARLEGPSLEHWMGTDRFGRDVASRVLAGSSITLGVGLGATAIAALLGIPLGLLAGMGPGWVDGLVARGADLLLAFPALLLAIVATAVFGASATATILAVGVAGVSGFIRVTRAGTRHVMGLPFIDAARLAEQPPLAIAVRHVLPNIAGTLVVQVTVTFALAILAEAGLSFLGLGTAPPAPSWGRMVQDAQASLGTAPLLAVWPGLAIALTVLGLNLAGDGLRDLLDPRREASHHV